MAIMDTLSKGKPLSSTYLEIWCRSYDECVVALSRPMEMAFGAGFSGQRAEQTWQTRVRLLADLGFIQVKPGPAGPLGYALLLNPYRVIKRLKAERPGFPEDLFNALVQRAIEIGAKDLELDSFPSNKLFSHRTLC